MTPKQTWQERCKEINDYHLSKTKTNKGWGVRDTAKDLRLGIGTVSEDIQLAHYFKVYPLLEDFKFRTEALVYLRQRRQDVRLRV